MTADPHSGAPTLRAGAPAGSARLGLVLLHGRGGGAEDMLELGAAMGRDDIAVIAPQAADRSWWPVSFLDPTAALQPWLDSALRRVGEATAMLHDEGLDPGRIAVGGFSQGACLALEHVARTGAPLHAVVALSGGLVGTGDAAGEASAQLYGRRDKRFDYSARLDGVRALLACHDQDPHIPAARVRRSAQVLTAMGAQVDLRLHRGASHGLATGDLEAMRALLSETV